jgi:purine nucleoside phosphorylase
MATTTTTTTTTSDALAAAPRTLGVIGGSSLFHASAFSALAPRTVPTEFGAVVLHEGLWRGAEAQAAGMRIVFVQRHHADPDGAYRQPRQINFRAIAAALKQRECDAVVGIYSVGSMTQRLQVGR